VNQRTKRRIDTGFKNLRDLMICCLGGYGFWFQITRVRNPEPFVLVVCGVLMAAPGILAVWRVTSGLVNDQSDPDREALRRLVREELEKERGP